MKYDSIRQLRANLYFTVEDLANLLEITSESARVLCSRYTKKGLFVRLKKNVYILSERWDVRSRDDVLRICNILQVPSYLSFMTALSLYEVTTQVQRDFYENASVKRSVRYDVQGVSFHYYKLQKKYYFDFIRKDDLFIATPEKAFIDSVYLYSFGKYALDFSSIDIHKLDKDRIRDVMKGYPKKTIGIVRKICGI